MVSWSVGYDPSDSDIVLPLREGLSNRGVRSFFNSLLNSLALDWLDNGAELRLLLLFDRWLPVDRRDGAVFVDLTDVLRSGMTTTGMPPFFHTSRRALRLATELTEPVETWLLVRAGSISTLLETLGRLAPSGLLCEVVAELEVENSELESRRPICFLT